MKSLVLAAHNRFEIQERPLPEIGSEDVLLKVAACGICGSDVHGMDGSTGRRRPPIIMGHEAAGVICRGVGSTRARLEGGRPRHFRLHHLLRQCCDSAAAAGPTSATGAACWAFPARNIRQAGAFAEFVAVPQRILCRVPDAVGFRNATMVEPFAIALHAVSRTRIRLDDTAVVVGAGIIGLLLVQALRTAIPDLSP